jgi:hypothetical protein
MSASNEAINPSKEVHLSHLPPPPRPVLESPRAKTEQDQTSNTGLSLPSFVYMALLITFLLLGIVVLRLINHRIQVRAATPPASMTAATAPAGEQSTPSSSVSTSSGTSADAGTTLVVAPPLPAPLKLQAVFYSPTKPSAIVSGSTVGIGDKVRQFHVTAIGKDSVTLSSSTETRVLKLLQ